jgi:hypothetical protein
MKKLISDRHIVVVLFVMVFVTFSLAHEDSKDFEQTFSNLKPLAPVEKTAALQPATPEASVQVKESLQKEIVLP